MPFTPINHNVFKMKGQLDLPTASGEFILPNEATCSVANVDSISFTCDISDRANGIVTFQYSGSDNKASSTWNVLLNKNIIITINKITNIQSLKPSTGIVQSTLTNTADYCN